MDPTRLHPADQLVLYMQRIYDARLTTTSGGNLSIRDRDGSIWITPGSVDKGSLTRNDIIRIRPGGAVEGPHKPSVELPFHTAIYKARPDLHAVLHAHPPALVGFALRRQVPDLTLLPKARRVCGEVGRVAYAVPGSQSLGRDLGALFAAGSHAAILDNHGVCTGGADFPEAFRRFTLLNEAAEIECLARRAGRCAVPASTAPEASPLPEFTLEAPSSEELDARREMAMLLRRACRTGLFTAASGVCSMRLASGGFLITPTGADRAYLEADDLVLIRDGCRPAGQRPSAASSLHDAIYRANPEVQVILQARPRHAMAFAVSDARLNTAVMPESYVFLRDLPKLPCPPPPEAFGPACPAALLANDSALVTGSTLLQAFDRLEVLETTARAVLCADAVGSLQPISEPGLQEMREVYQLP